MVVKRKGKRVVIVVQNLPVPFDRRVWLEATSLTNAGYDVTCICPKAKGHNASFEEIEGIRIHRYKLPGDAQSPAGFVFEFLWCFLRTAMKLGRIGATRGFDVLHVCNPPETFFPLGWLSRAFGKKFLFDHHDLSPEMFDAKADGDSSKILRRGLLRLERETFRAAQMVITTNESHKAIATGRGKMAPDDVVVVRSGPDLTRLEKVEPNPEWKNGKDYLVAYLGEICEQDGVDHLIRAMKVVRDDLGRNDVHCVLMGGGPHQPAIKEYAAEIGVDDICQFTGRISDEGLCEVLSTADVGADPDPLTPWSNQSTMNKIMEYMYFELPIASYDLKEARVSAADAAVYAEPNNERALADAIVELLDSPEERQKMGAIGRERIVEKLSWEHSEPHLLAAYEELLKPKVMP